LATSGLVYLAAATVAATSAEEAPQVQQTRKAPKKCKVNGCPALHNVLGLIYGFFPNLGDRNQSGESIMQELAKTASRVDALDTLKPCPL
jgi:hypothetical protein